MKNLRYLVLLAGLVFNLNLVDAAFSKFSYSQDSKQQAQQKQPQQQAQQKPLTVEEKINVLNCLMKRLFDALEQDDTSRLAYNFPWMLSIIGTAATGLRYIKTSPNPAAEKYLYLGLLASASTLTTRLSRALYLKRKNRLISSNINKIFNNSDFETNKNLIIKTIKALYENNIELAKTIILNGYKSSMFNQTTTYDRFETNDLNIQPNLTKIVNKNVLEGDIYQFGSIYCKAKDQMADLLKSNKKNEKLKQFLSYSLFDKTQHNFISNFLKNDVKSCQIINDHVSRNPVGNCKWWFFPCKPLTAELFKTAEYQNLFFDFVKNKYKEDLSFFNEAKWQAEQAEQAAKEKAAKQATTDPD